MGSAWPHRAEELRCTLGAARLGQHLAGAQQLTRVAEASPRGASCLLVQQVLAPQVVGCRAVLSREVAQLAQLAHSLQRGVGVGVGLVRVRIRVRVSARVRVRVRVSVSVRVRVRVSVRVRVRVRVRQP